MTKVPETLPAATTAVQPTAAAPETGVKRGGVLRTTYWITNLRFNDPAIATDTTVANVYRQVCDWLVRVGPDQIVRPALATEWVPSEDGKSWTLKLRQGVKFTHGKAFNADDVLFTFNRLLDPATASVVAGLMNYIKPGDIEKVDDYTVIFHCSRVVPDFPYHLHDYHSAILPADWTGDFYEAPWGTGPFTIVEHRPEELLVYKRRPDYWDIAPDGQPYPYLDGMEVITYADETAVLDALRNGELHMMIPSIASLPAIEKIPGVLIDHWMNGAYREFVLRCDSKPFDDPRMRRALKLAVDRDLYLTNFAYGYGTVAYDSPIAPLSEAYPPIKPFKRDVEKAKALMAEAGYPDGVDLTIKLRNVATQDGVWIQESAKEAGFRSTAQPSTPPPMTTTSYSALGACSFACIMTEALRSPKQEGRQDAGDGIEV